MDKLEKISLDPSTEPEVHASSETVQQRRILHVGNFLSRHKQNRQFIEDLADRLEQRGWTVTRTSHFMSRPLRLADMLFTICWHRKDYDIAQIDVFSGGAFRWAEASAWMLSALACPYVVTLHGGSLPTFAQREPRRVRQLLNSASVVTTPSLYLYEEMRPYRPDLYLLPNPIDLNHYHFRARTSFEPKLIWLRAFHSIYNPTLAPRALALLVEEFQGIHLTMVGPDKHDGSYQKTRQLAMDLGIEGKITFLAGIPKAEVPHQLDQADLFINTTNVDNTPISVMEAMASGLGIVSTNVGGIPYLLEDEYDALLVPPEDPRAMANAIRRLLIEPDLTTRLFRNGREKVEKLDWSAILEKWEEVLLYVLNERGRLSPTL